MHSPATTSSADSLSEAASSYKVKHLTLNIPPIARGSWSFPQIHEATVKLKETITAQSWFCVRELEQIDPITATILQRMLIERVESQREFPRIDEFTEKIYKPIKSKLLPGIANRSKSSPEHNSVKICCRFIEFLQIYSLLNRDGALVFLRKSAERARITFDESAQTEFSSDQHAWDFLKRVGQASVYHKNNDWFSKEIFEPMTIVDKKFAPYSPRLFREKLFKEESFISDLDSALRHAAMVGNRDISGGGHVDPRLSRLMKLPGVESKKNTFIICADKLTAIAVNAYVSSSLIYMNGYQPKVLYSAKDAKALLPDATLINKSTNLIFFGIGPQALLHIKKLDENAILPMPLISILIYQNSPDAWTLEEKLGISTPQTR